MTKARSRLLVLFAHLKSYTPIPLGDGDISGPQSGDAWWHFCMESVSFMKRGYFLVCHVTVTKLTVTPFPFIIV